MKPQFGTPQHPKRPRTLRGAGAVRRGNNRAQVFQRLLPPRLLPRELQKYDQPGVRLQPLVVNMLSDPAEYQLPEDLLFPARSAEYLPRCYLTRCRPNRARWLLSLANGQNCGEWRVQSIPRPIGPL